MPQKFANNKILDWTSGRLSGGGSSVNGMQYVKTSDYVLREWEKIAGPLWGPKAAVDNQKIIEKYNGQTNNQNSHGYTGRLDVRQTPLNAPIMTKKLVAAIENATNYGTILDYNDPATPIGPFLRWQLTQKPNGERASASNAFLFTDELTHFNKRSVGRNLIISYKTTALRILFNENKDAVGIEYLKKGIPGNIYARKKVIISAGINSPKLLMLSGIGPSDHLRSLNIPVVFNNPNVGQNLVDHTINMAVFNVNPADIDDVLEVPTSLYNGGAFLPAPNGIPYKRNIQLIGSYANGSLSLYIISLCPKSKGSITIQNNDPLKFVLVDYRTFEDPYDLELLKLVYKNYIVNIATALASIDSKYQLITPSLEVIRNDELLEQYIKDTVSTTYHPQCLLKMAPYLSGGVVDYMGRVYGVNNLIVADNSIIPTVTDGNTQSTSYLIGYTIARQLIAEDRLQPTPYSY